MPIPLRTDYDAGLVRIAAKKTKDGPQARRLLALAAALATSFTSPGRSMTSRTSFMLTCGSSRFAARALSVAWRAELFTMLACSAIRG